jgi:hypothetical protein
MNAPNTDLHENKQMPKRPSNPHTGSNFDDFLKADGIYEEVHATATKRVLAKQKEDVIADTGVELVRAKQETLPYGLLKGKLKIKRGFDDALPNDLLPGFTNAVARSHNRK